MGNRKSFQDLEISDAFLFASVMEDEKICKGFLRMVLGAPVDKVWIRTERVIGLDRSCRSVRLDVFVDNGSDSMYDIEMQGQKRKNLYKRTRFYQGQMDAGDLKPRGDFTELRKSYVIFICLFDPFDKGRYRYTFEERCLEGGFPLGDDTQKIFLSTEGKNPDEVPKELVLFLDYVKNAATARGRVPQDVFVTQVDARVQALKESGGLEAEYMLFGELLDEEREEGWQEGREEGREAGRLETKQELASLVSALIKAGKADLLPRLEDPAFLDSMLKRYS